jgi:methyltransferase, FkbM family
MDREAFFASPPPIARELRTIFSQAAPAVIFDIGSWEGEDAIRYSRLFPSSTVYVFEPLASNMEILEASLKRHGANQVVPVQLALSDSSGEAEIWVSSGRPADADPTLDWDYGNESSSLLEPAEHLRIHPWVRFERTEVIRTESVEGFAHRAGISAIGFAHLDVQGNDEGRVARDGVRAPLPRSAIAA